MASWAGDGESAYYSGLALSPSAAAKVKTVAEFFKLMGFPTLSHDDLGLR